jgi:hypothetical protein
MDVSSFMMTAVTLAVVAVMSAAAVESAASTLRKTLSSTACMDTTFVGIEGQSKGKVD